MKELIGPFTQLVTLENLPLKGAVSGLEIISQGGLLVENGLILETGNFDRLRVAYPGSAVSLIEEEMAALPGFIDAHTHLLFGGSRAADYEARISGKTYTQIAAAGGGIWDTVSRTREMHDEDLVKGLLGRLQLQLAAGITTTEVKTGYGLNPEQELRMVKLIERAGLSAGQDVIATCLAAHMKPRDFSGSAVEYLQLLLEALLPRLRLQTGCNRIDIFIEEGAFNVSEARTYLKAAKAMGFELCIHADQFSPGGSALAVELQALSADHLEASTEKETSLLAASTTAAIVLPGASLGLGMAYAPARALLDAGASLVIASDWNPGSAPMGNLLMQASVLSAAQKLSAAEVYAALTFRAAHALGLKDRGVLKKGMLADFQGYPVADHREILYHQGMLVPSRVWKRGLEKDRSTPGL